MEENKVFKFPIQYIPLFKQRIFAFLCDFIAIAIISKSLIHTYIYALKKVFHLFTYKQQFLIMSNLELIHIGVFSITYISYFIFNLYASNGRTLGKMIFNIRIVSQDGNKITLLKSFQRSIGYYVCYLSSFLLFIIPFLKKNYLGLPDIFSKTHNIFEIKNQKNDSKQKELPLSKAS